jgi:hypothetical protein
MRTVRNLGHAFMAVVHRVVSSLIWVVTIPFAGVELLRQLRVELWSVEGNERNSGLPLSILFAAHGADRHFLLHVLFADAYCERCLGRFWLWNIAKAIPAAASPCSMILAQMFESKIKFARPGDCLFVPMWLFGEVDLPRDEQATRRVKRDLRTIRQHALQCEVTRDPARLDDFYHNMLVPYDTNTFGVCADIVSYHRVKEAFPSCDLLLVKHEEKAVAGVLLSYFGKHPHLWEMGIRDGNREYLKIGAGFAWYHFALQYLQDQGHKKAGLGWSRPFLRDGVLQLKRKWSQKLTVSANYGFAFRVLSHTPAAKAFLCNNPFVFRRDGRFFGAVFVDGDTQLSAEDIQQIDKDYFHPGMAKLAVYFLDREHPPATNLVPPELAERIEIRCADDLLGVEL